MKTLQRQVVDLEETILTNLKELYNSDRPSFCSAVKLAHGDDEDFQPSREHLNKYRRFNWLDHNSRMLPEIGAIMKKVTVGRGAMADLCYRIVDFGNKPKAPQLHFDF